MDREKFLAALLPLVGGRDNNQHLQMGFYKL